MTSPETGVNGSGATTFAESGWSYPPPLEIAGWRSHELLAGAGRPCNRPACAGMDSGANAPPHGDSEPCAGTAGVCARLGEAHVMAPIAAHANAHLDLTAKRLHNVAQGRRASGAPWVNKQPCGITLKGLNNIASGRSMLCNSFGVGFLLVA